MTDSQSDWFGSAASRRKFLSGTGAAGAIALAGCTASDDGDDGSDSEDGDDTSSDGSDNSDGSDGDSTENTELSGEIDIAGSSTVFPLMDAIAEEFAKDHSQVSINLSSTGSGGGFSNHFCPGNTDFNNASRPIKEEEKQLCSDNDVDYIELVAATDALTVVVSNEHEVLGDDPCITVEELAQIWEADGASTWSDVNSEWPDKSINRFGAADTSGTYDYFIENVQGTDRGHTDDYQPTEDDETIIQGVSGDPYAIGYFGFAYYYQNPDQAQAVKIDNGDGCVAPSLETAASGEYQPLSRSLFTYPSMSSLAKEHVAEFARYFVEQTTNEEIVAERVGYVPATEETKKAQMEKLEEAISEAQ
ncbi:phosphate ABC transporter substrate-binding protein, PhoT family [Halovenus aranensis]|uniref:Phosphate ABC transporter substrate-binding protein, PhoT family n=1 Tax=Halovenus aranensis TaxID=890420 RepID=A0A1G8YFY3_9EURY|nr:PstS family phosphate ABC transporter substrate-binding protein [Halovenus aranensis]SDK01742.1 phosphate ABC transporter substrate-binding protein, PhoT family [Halovenus aranensis]